jgi:hypothetical protein
MLRNCSTAQKLLNSSANIEAVSKSKVRRNAQKLLNSSANIEAVSKS